MANKSILVTYLDRNKIIQLSSSNVEKTDLTMLEERFRKDFKFVGVEITFQRLQVGEIYIDLDEDSILYHKDRLKAMYRQC